jgi:cation:H+ antiporter
MPTASVTSDLVTFGVGGVAAIGASAVLARRIEQVGSRLQISESLLGLVAALAADSPEITSSVTALRNGQHAVGIGVVLGSNVFNLAALLGLGALVAGRISLHRKVITFEGAVALTFVLATLLLATGPVGPGVAALVALAGFVPYCTLIGMRARTLAKLPLPRRVLSWLATAVRQEDVEWRPLPRPRARHAAFDVVAIPVSLAVVVVASVMMERAGVHIGVHYHLSPIVVGGILLAAVTSLPNAVAAIYLARRGRGAAVLSEAMNSNALNVLVGLLLPGLLLGLGARSGSLGIAWWYAGLTAAALAVAWLRSGLGRISGALILVAYGAFVAVLVVAP